MCRLQWVQNAAARLVTGVRRCDHVTPILRQLHWLPVRQRVLFKIAVLVFICLAGQAPSYLSDDCRPVSDSRPRRLRSSDSLSCVVRRAHNTYSDWCFATAGPRVWNSLPAELQQCSSLRQFKRCLKTFLFGSWDSGALWLFVKQRGIEIVLLTYLLTYLLTGPGTSDAKSALCISRLHTDLTLWRIHKTLIQQGTVLDRRWSLTSVD